MDVFISWSGERSKSLALALRNWLPKIINAVTPWLSSADIVKGARWSVDVASKLEQSKVGIICLTPSNVHSDWILFEAGALSKTLQNTLVCPLLIDLMPSDISGPLSQFQATRANKDEIRNLLVTINAALGDQALADSHLSEAFEVWWPRLEEALKALPPEKGTASAPRPEREILEEILALVREGARNIAQGEPGSSPAKARLTTARIVGKSQITIPRDVVERFGLREGDFLEWKFLPDSAIQITPQRPSPVAPNTLNEINGLLSKIDGVKVEPAE